MMGPRPYKTLHRVKFRRVNIRSPLRRRGEGRVRKTVVLVLLAVSASAHAANVHYDLGWILPSQIGLMTVVGLGVAAMMMLRHRNGSPSMDRRRAA